MRIFLVSDSKTGINFFPELEGVLRKKIADLDLDTVFVPFPEDVPAAVANVLDEADLVFVFVLYGELDFRIQVLLNKLVDVDMKSKAKVVKVIEESDLGSMNEPQLEREKQSLAEKWSKFILDYLFNPDVFKPKEETSSLGDSL